MIEISIAGAGAGKTYQLAQAIIQYLQTHPYTHKKIYAVTYTNAAKSEIETELIKQFGYIPSNIEVQTVHTFLLNEIIYPYSPFITGDTWITCSIFPLSPEPRLKNWQLGKLKKKQIIHIDNVYSIARKCTDTSHSAHNTKLKKTRVKRGLDIIKACTEKIFVDEVQDLDKDALQTFICIGLSSCDVFMVGDPKQAIKYPDVFESFLQDLQNNPNEHIVIHPANNSTRRVPEKVLALSNKFCYTGQDQKNVLHIVGSISFIEATHPNYVNNMNKWTTSENCLVYIDKRVGAYQENRKKVVSLPQDAEEHILGNAYPLNPELALLASKLKLEKAIVTKGKQRAIHEFVRKHQFPNTRQVFAQLMSSLPDASPSDAYQVKSIEGVKGLEANTCVLILTPNSYRYLAQIDLTPSQKFNKEWKKMYVALTRAKKEFIVVLDHDLFLKSDFDVSSIKSKLIDMGFTPFT